MSEVPLYSGSPPSVVQISYEDILAHFWTSHDASGGGGKRQYMSAIFAHGTHTNGQISYGSTDDSSTWFNEIYYTERSL